MTVFWLLKFIPTDPLALSESRAINLYLAKKYGSDGALLYSSFLEDEANVWR